MGDMLDDDMDRWDDERVSRAFARPDRATQRLSREATLRRSIARSERELAELESRREELAQRFGEEPPVGSVIAFVKMFPGSAKTYTYAALRTGGERVVGSGWFLTGRDGSRPRTWESLCEFIGNGPFRVIPASDAQPRKAWAINADGASTEFYPRHVAPEAFQPALGRSVRAGRKSAIAVFPTSGKAVFDSFLRGFGVLPRSDVLSATEPKSMTELALEKLRPFIVGREGDENGRWLVIDERLYAGGITEIDPETGLSRDVVKTYPASDKGEARARQSVRDRNRAYREQIRRLEIEPPLWSRVSSVDDARKWARRQGDGWIRYNGSTVVAVRLNWESVKLQLGEVRPGTGQSYELVTEPLSDAD